MCFGEFFVCLVLCFGEFLVRSLDIFFMCSVCVQIYIMVFFVCNFVVDASI